MGGTMAGGSVVGRKDHLEKQEVRNTREGPILVLGVFCFFFFIITHF
jgi:hypothetical protein